MKSLMFVVTATFLYAVSNVLIERKLVGISPIVNTLVFCLGIIVIALPVVILGDKIGVHVALPGKHQYWVLALCGVIIFFADFCFFSSYYHGGNLVLITTTVVLLPVFASFIKFLVDGSVPNSNQLLGWALAAISVFLVSKP